MDKFGFLCTDLESAKRSRENVASGNGNAWWDSQKHALEGVPLDAPLPSTVVVGELPDVSEGRRTIGKYLAKDHEED